MTMKHNSYILMLLLLFGGVLKASAQQTRLDTTKTQQIKEIVVTADRQGRKVGEIRRTAEQLKVEMPMDMNDLVRYIPSVGVSVSGSRGGMRGFAIRGVEANRVAICIDGILQPEIQDNVVFSSYGLSNASRIDFDPYFASSVEIQKGANSFASGTGALGGTVNYATKEARDLIGENKSWGLLSTVNYNGKENLRTYLLGGAVRLKHVDALLMAAHRDGNELRNFSHGKLTRNITSTQIDPMDFHQATWLGKLSYAPNDNHRFVLAFYAMNRKTNADIWTLEPIDAFTADGKPYYYSHDQSLCRSLSFSYRFLSEKGLIRKLTTKVHHQNSYLDASSWTDFYRPNFDLVNSEMTLVYEGKHTKYRGQATKDHLFRLELDSKKFHFGAFGQHIFNLTAMAMRRKNDTRNVDMEAPQASDPVTGYTVRMGKVYRYGEPMGMFAQTYSFLNPITRLNYGVSLMDDIAFGKKLTMKLGARYDRFTTKDDRKSEGQNLGYIHYLLQNMQGAVMNFDPIDDKEAGFSFLGIVSYAHSQFLNASYRFSTGFRVPNTEEQYFQFYSAWPSFVVLSNRALKAEKSYNHELELSGKGWGFGYLLSFYYNHYADFIELKQGTLTVKEPLMQTPKNISYVKNVNQTSANLKGFDVALQFYPEEWTGILKGFMVSSAFSYAEGRSSSGMSMLGIQPLTGNIGLEYTAPKARWQVNAKANLYFAKPVSQTTFWDKDAAGKELIRRYPASFMSNAYTFDAYGYYKITRNLTVRAGIYNILNSEYLRWDDLRQLTNPALLSNINYFFQDGKKSLSRFSRPKRYVSLALEYKL